MPQEIIKISNIEPFSKGGNRLCFVSPNNPNICLKIHQRHRTPEIRRKNKSFPANLRPLKIFNENLQEYLSLKKHTKHFPQSINSHLPKSHGMVSTDLGIAHATEMIRDDSGLISETLEIYIWQHGRDDLVNQTLSSFQTTWCSSPPRSPDIIPHNLVIKRTGNDAKIIVIDGFSRSPWLPLIGGSSSHKAKLRFDKLNRRIDEILRRKNNNTPKDRLNNLNRHL